MKKFFLVLALLIVALSSAFSQRLNSFGFDLGGYMIKAPKTAKGGDAYNPYIESSSSLMGLFYEREITSSIRVKGGGYANKQFNSVVSLHVPLEVNGNLIGESMLYLGYTAGLSANFNRLVVTGLRIPVSGTRADISIIKDFYVAPHAGFHAGLKYGRFDLRSCFLFHFLIPEIVEFTTEYPGVSESNTNGSIGFSIRFGGAYRF